MLTHEYQRELYGIKFEHLQSIIEPFLTECPECHGNIQRLATGGSEFILKTSRHTLIIHERRSCPFGKTAKTCCGRDERYQKSACGEE